MKTLLKQLPAKKSERGQAIILIAFAFIGVVAAAGLVTDTGLLLIEYGKLKRSVDAAAVAAAQEFRPDPSTGLLNEGAMTDAARSMLQINQFENVDSLVVLHCEGADRPDLCNPDPIGTPIANRKLVEVTATVDVEFAFLRVLGINSTTLTVSSIGEAATIDLVLLIDTSGSMAYETSGSLTAADSGDDPRQCNWVGVGNCEPMASVKTKAAQFVESLIYFGYDRVSIIAMTGQATNASAAVTRDPVEVLPLSFDESDITTAIQSLKVFQPRICDGTDTPGECLKYDGVSGAYLTPLCETFEIRIGDPDPAMQATADPSSCPSSNIGGMMLLAQDAYSGSGNPDNQRTQALWVTVMLASGPANASTPYPANALTHPYGYCPQNTWLAHTMPNPKPKLCRDAYTDTRHDIGDPLITYTNPLNGVDMDILEFDADDYARDQADDLAAMKTGNGVTIYTIGLGRGVTKLSNGGPFVVFDSNGSESGGTRDLDTDSNPDYMGEAEFLLQYAAEEAGDALNPNIGHGNYFYAPTDQYLLEIFDRIAQNISTKISQ